MSRSSQWSVLLVSSVAALAVAVGMSACSGAAQDPTPVALGEGPAVIVPIGPVPAHAVTALRRRLERMGFRTTTDDQLVATPSSIDSSRNQRIADVLLDQAVAAAAPAGADVPPMVIALTTDDIYTPERPEWAFVFSLRNRDGSGALLSTARMDPVNFGLHADTATIDRRLDAILVRVVGITRLGAATVSDPTCANRESVLSVDELDQMRPVLCNAA